MAGRERVPSLKISSRVTSPPSSYALLSSDGQRENLTLSFIFGSIFRFEKNRLDFGEIGVARSFLPDDYRAITLAFTPSSSYSMISRRYHLIFSFYKFLFL